MIEYNVTVINGNDELIHVAHFSNDDGSRNHFMYGKTLKSTSELINCSMERRNKKKIHLNAVVSKSHSQRNAIKFNLVDLEFRSNDQTINNHLSYVLQDFHARLTHMGQSNYRCTNDYYAISNQSLTLESSLGE